jgi:16S rRNA (guanine527-N7)-methyltransferase
VTDPTEELFGQRYPAAVRYVQILGSRGLEWGLIGPREVDRLWERHVLNSVALSQLIPQGSTLVDVGSGAGLPGIPLAILRPDLEITLLEPLLRRSAFLAQAVDELGITGQARVVRARAEEHGDTYDIVASRALAPLGRLLQWCAPIRSDAGVILALKGRTAADEVASTGRQLKAMRLSASVLTARAHSAAEPTSVVRIASL